MEKLNIKATTRISTGFLKVDRVQIGLPNGQEITREVLQKKNVIAILAITPDGEVFLTMQPRAGINNLESIEFPAGLVEAGEDYMEAAKRELLEETGCVSDKWTSLGFFVGDPACCTSVTHLFLAQDAEVVAEQHLDADEYLVKFTKPVAEVESMIESGVICDANSVIAFMRAKKYIV